jgi:hypothetical protein
MSRQTFGRRVNTWLAEPKGETFKHGKWRFWYPALVGLTALNALMTAVIFGSGGMQKYIGAVVMLAGAVLCWIAVGLLHYSDGDDRILALGVAILDSLSLFFVAAHFSLLLWAQGHLYILRAAEDQHRQDMATYNAQWKPVTESNDRIAQAALNIADIENKTERLRNDTAYWSKRNGIKDAPQSGLKVELSTTKVEVPPPPAAPKESSAAYLASWDSWIRMAGFGELALSIITLIFVRGRSTYLNSTRRAQVEEIHAEDFPPEIDIPPQFDVGSSRSTPSRGDLQTATAPRPKITPSFFAPKKETKKNHASSDSEGLKRLRQTLRDISFRLPGYSFKSYIRGDAVWILMMAANAGTQQTVSSAKAKLDLLADAITMDREAFQQRLENFLSQNGFDLKGNDE